MRGRSATKATWGLAAAIIGLLLGGVTSVWLVGVRPTPVTVDDAVSAFRKTTSTTEGVAGPTATGPATIGTTVVAASTATTSDVDRARGDRTVASAAAKPGSSRTSKAGTTATTAPTTTETTIGRAAQGVYAYATTGKETVSVLGGASHAYPATSTITNRHTGCGQTARWQPIQERWDEYELCPADGGRTIGIRSFTVHHEFFGQSDQRTYQCEPGAALRPAVWTPGTTFGGRCEGPGGATTDIHGTVVGPEQVVVGSTAVAGLHVHVEQSLRGPTAGTVVTDVVWTDDGRILSNTTASEADTDSPVGRTHYSERYSLRLLDPAPRT